MFTYLLKNHLIYEFLGVCLDMHRYSHFISFCALQRNFFTNENTESDKKGFIGKELILCKEMFVNALKIRALALG